MQGGTAKWCIQNYYGCASCVQEYQILASTEIRNNVTELIMIINWRSIENMK